MVHLELFDLLQASVIAILVYITALATR